MNRRTFLQVLSGLSVSLVPVGLLAQETHEIPEDAVAERPLEVIPESEIEWLDGFSMDPQCTRVWGIPMPVPVPQDETG